MTSAYVVPSEEQVLPSVNWCRDLEAETARST